MNKVVEFVKPCAPYNVGEKAGFPLAMAEHLVNVRKVAVFPKGSSTPDEDREARKREVMDQLKERKVNFFKGATLDQLEALLAGELNREQKEAEETVQKEAEAATLAMQAAEEQDPDRPKFSTLTLAELTAFAAKRDLHVDFAALPTLAHKQKLLSDAFDVQAERV